MRLGGRARCARQHWLSRLAAWVARSEQQTRRLRCCVAWRVAANGAGGNMVWPRCVGGARRAGGPHSLVLFLRLVPLLLVPLPGVVGGLCQR